MAQPDKSYYELLEENKQLQVELSLYQKGFCEAHQPLPEDTYEGCYRCDLVHLHKENKELKEKLQGMYEDLAGESI